MRKGRQWLGGLIGRLYLEAGELHFSTHGIASACDLPSIAAKGNQQAHARKTRGSEEEMSCESLLRGQPAMLARS